jgi:hypothetical protein
VQQIVPGIFHWTALHPSSGARASAYFVESAGALIDPLVPEEGLDGLPGRAARVLLSSGHHLRGALTIAGALGIPILASQQAVAHLGAAGDGIEGWPDGTPEVAPGIAALHLGVPHDDESTLHVDHGVGALVLADIARNTDEGLAFFPDRLLGEDPEGVKERAAATLGALAESLACDTLLFAHGEPIATGGADALRAFAARGQ